MTPLYKFLKPNGTSIYAFPGSEEHISASYQNPNFSMYFSKYILLNLPPQNLNPATNSTPVYFDFENDSSLGYGFQRSPSGQPTAPESYQDQLVESLRNYVANMEVVMKDSKLNNTEYFYDNNILTTPSEKIFWKWCKKLNILGLEAANTGDQYFGNLPEFGSNSVNDTSYFPEVLWTEKQVISWPIVEFRETSLTGIYTAKLEVVFNGTTNFQVNDSVFFTGISNSNVSYLNGLRLNVMWLTPAGATQGQSVVFDSSYVASAQFETTGTASLVYNKLVQYIGEVNGVNNVQEANKSYTEVYANIPSQTGQTPDILFRTSFDNNYSPGLVFPILPSQYQPEIDGAELFNSPIVSNPQNYPGNYFGQFDTLDFTYTTSNGDSLRRTGDYFGISGTINAPVIDTSNIDGLSIDFDTSHYVKMNIIGQEINNFDQFNALEVNNTPPKDFVFNAILWYYDVKDSKGNIATNLYGISFLDNPNNNPNPALVGLQIPVANKLVSNDNQDGTAYAFSTNLNFNILNENPQDVYNPSAINSLFSFSIFNKSMALLGSTNDSFTQIIANQSNIQNQLNGLTQLIYTQTDFATINAQISNLESLLTLYKTNQIISSDTIDVEVNNTSMPTITLNSKDSPYYQISNINTTDMYNTSGLIPFDINVPTNKKFLVHVTNNDSTTLTIAGNSNLAVIISRDLDYKQSFDLVVDATLTSTENKKLDVYINYIGGSSSSPIQTKLLSTIDLPVYYNKSNQLENSANSWEKFNFSIDTSSPILLNNGGILQVPIVGGSNIIYNSINAGDTFILDGFFVGTSSQTNFSGQYLVDSVGATNSYVYLNINSNPLLSSYLGPTSSGLPVQFNNILSNNPYFRLNKGVKYTITNIDGTLNSDILNRYLIEKVII